MIRLAVVLCLVSACSTPREYQRGAYRPPATFNPTTRAPHTTGHPGHLRPHTPRLPERALPPSTDTGPGFWGTSAPPATYTNPLLILDPDKILPDTPALRERNEAYWCTYFVQGYFMKPFGTAPIHKYVTWALPQQRCVTAIAYRACLLGLAEGYDASNRDLGALTRLLKVSEEFKKNECRGVVLPEDPSDLYESIKTKTRSSVKGGMR